MPAPSLDTIVSLCKRRGFIFPGSGIYGGLANTWDYGPLGVELKNRIKREWWKTFVHKRADMVGLDASILMNANVWKASGHIGAFSDLMRTCKFCKKHVREDQWTEQLKKDGLQTPCPYCGGALTEPKSFNLLFKTHQGVIEDEGTLIYLRPETAQGIFVNFRNILDTMRPRLPFGVAQIGKAFRNEITPGNFTFRTREFEQMEIEYFFDPDAQKWEEVYAEWRNASWSFITEMIGISSNNLRFRDHEKDELSHYSKATVDIEYKFPWGWGELCAAAAYRTDYDLKQHEKFSGQDLHYTDPDDPKRTFIPHVIEPSFGSDRITLAVLLDAYIEEEAPTASGGTDVRTVMKFSQRLAPVDIAVLPLSKKGPLIEKAKEVYQMLINETDLVVDFDVTGSIGKRYRRQDEIGTPLAITVDFGTLGEDEEQGAKDTVTIRDRDSLQQERVPIRALTQRLQDRR